VMSVVATPAVLWGVKKLKMKDWKD
jgi:hypothetical protein